MTSQNMRTYLLDLPVDAGATVADIAEAIGRKDACTTASNINPGAWATQKRKPEYVQHLKQMTYVMADGIGVSLVYRLLTGRNCPRISFDMTSMAPPFFERLERTKGSVAFVGSTPGTTQRFADKLLQSYPNINVVLTDDGYGACEPKIQKIVTLMPDAVIVGMGVPLQEAFLVKLAAAGYKGCAVTCGGFFDQYLQAETYYPRWIDQYNLRFAYRLYKEPQRLWRRYLIDYQVFIGLALRALIAKWLFRKSQDPVAKDSSDNGANRTNA
ncbi:MAG: WecB/TagA/CpsF family glycosyltransferase [Alphaproteobacteria bacterium]|nr:WecB/TagA/CpsF family glycosyltransferase [Alphaproteobacteria bacterium]MBV8549259.1 WecB/TagA/CpsF family glycosyltransferase [Alphaproteobacteria bacterium]